MPDLTTASTMTDRYVWAVTRHLGADTGPDVARELRGTIHDMVEAKVDAGADTGVAQADVLTELGDPDALARQYGGRPGYLIGPGVFSDYVRLMRTLLAVVVPLALVAVFVDRMPAADEPFELILLQALAVVLSVVVHLTFWTTLVFAVIEWRRPTAERDRPLTPWAADQLPSDNPWRRIRPRETLLSVAFHLLAIAVVVWQFNGVAQDGSQIQVLSPGLAPVWKAIIVGLLVADIARALALGRAGRWTPNLAAINVLVDVAGTIALVWLLLQGDLLVDDVPQQLAEMFDGAADWSVPTGLLAAALIAVAAWSSVDSVRQARRVVRASRG